MSGPGRLDVTPIHGPAAVAAAATQSGTFTARGEHLGLSIACTGAPGVTPITVQQLMPDATWAPMVDAAGAAIAFVPDLAAGTIVLACEGLVLMPGDEYRLTFTPTVAAGDITIVAQISNRSQTFGAFTADLVAAVGLATAELVVINNSTGLLATAVGQHDEPTADPGYRILGKATAAAAADVGDGNDAGISTDLKGQPRLASHTVATTSDRGEEVDPIDTRDLPSTWTMEGQADGTYYHYVSMEHLRDITAQWVSATPDGGTLTLTVEVTDMVGADETTLTYDDRTNAWWGAASFGAVGYFERAVVRPVVATWVRLKMVVAGSGGSAGWVIWTRRLY